MTTAVALIGLAAAGYSACLFALGWICCEQHKNRAERRRLRGTTVGTLIRWNEHKHDDVGGWQ